MRESQREIRCTKDSVVGGDIIKKYVIPTCFPNSYSIRILFGKRKKTVVTALSKRNSCPKLQFSFYSVIDYSNKNGCENKTHCSSSQRASKVGKVLALYAASPSLIPGTIYNIMSTAKNKL